MKKISLMILAIAAFGLTACSDDENQKKEPYSYGTIQIGGGGEFNLKAINSKYYNENTSETRIHTITISSDGALMAKDRYDNYCYLRKDVLDAADIEPLELYNLLRNEKARLRCSSSQGEHFMISFHREPGEAPTKDRVINEY